MPYWFENIFAWVAIFVLCALVLYMAMTLLIGCAKAVVKYEKLIEKFMNLIGMGAGMGVIVLLFGIIIWFIIFIIIKIFQ